MALTDDEAAALPAALERTVEAAAEEADTARLERPLPPSVLDHDCPDAHGLVGWVWCSSHGGRWHLRVPMDPMGSAFAYVLIAFCPFCGEKLPEVFAPGGPCPEA